MRHADPLTPNWILSPSLRAIKEKAWKDSNYITWAKEMLTLNAAYEDRKAQCLSSQPFYFWRLGSTAWFLGCPTYISLSRRIWRSSRYPQPAWRDRLWVTEVDRSVDPGFPPSFWRKLQCLYQHAISLAGSMYLYWPSAAATFSVRFVIGAMLELKDYNAASWAWD